MVVDVTLDPIITQIGPFQLGWHGVFTALAVMTAVWVGWRGAVGRGVPAAALERSITWALVGGVVGARFFHVLDHLPAYLANPLAVLAVWQGGIAVYGAFLGGIAGGLLAAHRARLAPWPLLDAAAPAMLVGQAIGRLGCLANGDAWGAPCGALAPLCLAYGNPHDLLPAALLGVPTHPYPLYEIAADLLLLLALGRARRPGLRPGDTFLAAVVGYAAIRFGLTFFRQEAVVLWGLQEAQVVAAITASLALGVWLLRARQPRGGGDGRLVALAGAPGGQHQENR